MLVCKASNHHDIPPAAVNDSSAQLPCENVVDNRDTTLVIMKWTGNESRLFLKPL
jgi:hypothetical protein